MRTSRTTHGLRAPRRGGFALLIVLVVLLALLVLCTPFLMAARNADRSSSELADRQAARIGLDVARRHARAFLYDSYPSASLDGSSDGSSRFDRTPYFDSLEEIEVGNAFPPTFLDASNQKGPMWDLEVEDIAGKIDLNSASPQVVANLLGLSARFADVIKTDSKELPLSGGNGLEPTGFVWAEGELISYARIQDSKLVQFVRGVLGPADDKSWRGGPRPPSAHGIGTPVLDQRAFAPCLWRLMGEPGTLRAYEALEEVPQCATLALAAATDARGVNVIGAELLRPLLAYGTVHAGPRGGAVWQRPVRLTTAVEAQKDGRIQVDNPRWINAGSTLRISDGQSTELAIVSDVSGAGGIALDRILQNEYQAYETTVEVLVRRPVNVNTASKAVLETLFLNLQVRGKNQRVTRDEAEQLADIALQSRPFTGFEDFLRRLVLPCAAIEALPADALVFPDALQGSTAIIDSWDAVAIYANALNSNDALLAYSTMPLCFTTRDSYALELRSTVNADSGAERFSIVRDEVVLVAPQTELISVWARQEDFDEAFRLDGEAPWWMTGPNATTRYEGQAGGTAFVPPSRLWSHMGSAEGRVFLPGVTDDSVFKDRAAPPPVEHIFASRDETAWIQLMPTRVDEMGLRAGRVLHFDHETRDLEGRYLPDQVFESSTDDKLVAWTEQNLPLVRPPSFSVWFKLRSATDSKLVDVGGVDGDVDHVSLMLDGADLVLRVLDGTGDHRLTNFKEMGELRYAIAPADGSPGLPTDVWHHANVDVRGNRPSQMNLLVNGLAHGVRTPGLTRLAGSLSQNAALIPVDSVEGFPPTCCVRIGTELIEVIVDGGTMRAERQLTGKMAGFGGRIAREPFTSLTDGGADVPATLATIHPTHPAGTSVELHGYSLPFLSNVATGRSQMQGEVGPFRVAMVTGMPDAEQVTGDPVMLATPIGDIQFGYGLVGARTVPFQLNLRSADDKDSSPAIATTEFMPAFHTQGGYAVLVQALITINGDPAVSGGFPLGGVEIVRYSGWTGNALNIVERGVRATQDRVPDLLQANATEQRLIGGTRGFVVKWEAGALSGLNLAAFQAELDNRMFVVPISIPVPGASAVQGFVSAQKGKSGMAQITHVDDAEMTEWVRYDWFDATNIQLVREDPTALADLHLALTHSGIPLPNPPGPGGGGGGGGGGGTGGPAGGGVHGLLDPTAEPHSAVLTIAASAPAAQASGGSQWDPRVGENENPSDTWPVTRAAETAFEFRGVMGTSSHKHANGTPIFPCFEVALRSQDGGKPGRLDTVFLVGPSPDHPGWPVIVHRAHAPSAFIGLSFWEQNDDAPIASAATAIKAHEPYLTQRVFVGLQDRCPEPFTPGGVTQTTNPIVDSRLLARLVCFPSGERPRLVSRVQIGGGVNGSTGAIPPAVVDEFVFGDAQFGRSTPSQDPEALAGASLVLFEDVDEAIQSFLVMPKTVQITLGHLGSTLDYLDTLPADGGLLRIGDEILGYQTLDAQAGRVNVAVSGRGLLGTTPGAHQQPDPVLFLESFSVTTLSGNIGAGDAALAIVDADGFPGEGTVLIGEELIHYTRLRGTSLEMPRASTVPGAHNEKGDGLFRGRFGTQAAPHSGGELVILFPTRYVDRWAEQADAPEMAYFGFQIDQPAAFWTGVFYSKVDTEGARLGVLQRTDPAAPWDANPEQDKRMALHWNGEKEAAPIAIARQSNRIQWRAFVDYLPGAFDLRTGTAHGWRQTPRLKMFSAFYYAPSMVLRSVER